MGKEKPLVLIETVQHEKQRKQLNHVIFQQDTNKNWQFLANDILCHYYPFAYAAWRINKSAILPINLQNLMLFNI